MRAQEYEDQRARVYEDRRASGLEDRRTRGPEIMPQRDLSCHPTPFAPLLRSSSRPVLVTTGQRALLILFSEQFPDLRADGGGGFAFLVLMGGDDVDECTADDHAVGDLGDGLDVGGGGDAEAQPR